MIVIGERLNTSRKAINEAMDKKDQAFFENEAKKQEEAGANYIDVNCGSRLKSEMEDFLWLLDIVQNAVSVPVALDSPDANVLKAGLENVKQRPIVNSITLENERFDQVAPLVEGDAADVVALCMDDEGIPKTPDKVIENGIKLVEKLEGIGVKRTSMYLDILVQPLSVESENGNYAFKAIETLMQKLPGIHTTCGLSNISFGLPERFLFNRTFMIIAMSKGLDSAIIDPLDKKMMTAIYTANAMLGKDFFCGDFLDAMRAGKIQN